MQCFLCNEKFSKIRTKEDHIRSFHNDKRVCGTCGERFKAAISLERHVKSHIIEPEHMCHMCGKKYQLLHRLNSHIRSKHTESSAIINEYICDICGYNIKHRGNLTRHMKTRHMKITGFGCNLCSITRTFTTKNSLDQHIYNTHKVEAPFKCVACNRGFPTESNLRSHNTHNCKSLDKKKNTNYSDNYFNEIPDGFQCKLCDMVYVTQEKFRTHYKSKHRFSLKCNICGQQMGTSASLRRHKKTIHENLKPFKCPYCEKSFGQKTSLDSHR